MPSTPDTLNERFEKKVVFRLARWLPLGLGVLASVALVIALLVLVYAFSPSFAPKEPAPLETPKPVTITAADIQQAIAAPATPAPEAPAAEAAEAPAPAAPSAPDPRAVALGNELGKLHALGRKAGLPFLDVTETRCTNFSYGQCWSQREVKVRDGIGNRVLEAIALYEDEGEHEKVKVAVTGTDLTINVTLDSQVETRTAVLQELNALLAAAPAGKVSQWFDTWMELRETREQAQRRAVAEAHEQAVEAFQVAQDEHEATVASKGVLRMSSLSALGLALGIFVFCGMVLAVLAIERHSRALRELAEHLRQPAPAPLPPAAAPPAALETSALNS